MQGSAHTSVVGIILLCALLNTQASLFFYGSREGKLYFQIIFIFCLTLSSIFNLETNISVIFSNIRFTLSLCVCHSCRFHKQTNAFCKNKSKKSLNKRIHMYHVISVMFTHLESHKGINSRETAFLFSHIIAITINILI